MQTKFTSLDGQDLSKPLPYDRDAPLATQVRFFRALGELSADPVLARSQVQQSFATSLEQLGTSYIDSLVMHSPMCTKKENLIVWKEFEALVKEGKVRRAFAMPRLWLTDHSSSPYRYASLASPTFTIPTSFNGRSRPSKSSPRSCERQLRFPSDAHLLANPSCSTAKTDSARSISNTAAPSWLSANSTAPNSNPFGPSAPVGSPLLHIWIQES